MMTPALKRAILFTALAGTAVAGCGRFSGDSAWSPSGWFSPSSEPETLAPEGGYPTTATTDARALVPAATGARFEPLIEGRLLVVEGITPTKGWSDAELVTLTPQPRGRFSPDPDGVLRLRFVAAPPPPGTVQAQLPAQQPQDRISVALTLPTNALARITEVQVQTASNTISLRPR